MLRDKVRFCTVKHNIYVVAQICLVLSEGSAMAMLLVLVLLPGVLAALDRFTAPRGSVREGGAGEESQYPMAYSSSSVRPK